MIPKNLTDSKVAGGKDRESVVGINAKPSTNFQETSKNQTTRGLIKQREAVHTFANKTTSILGNINGEIFGI